MKYLKWTDELSVNIQEIDDQHQELINLVNEMCEAADNGKGNDILEDILIRLTEFVKIHFATEERLMKIHVYPDLASHEKEHTELKNYILELYNRFNTGQPLPAKAVENFLNIEIISHFQKSDMKFGLFLNNKGLR